ncbi:MAG TPA: gamma-glutamylcyclotransferase family protein [Pseudomonadales bacterium]|nr:gamma-glutamylcyclotransferase family protein [Pseudomonadales bacterium]
MATHYYFAYGSNMNQDRMRARAMRFNKAQRAVLKGFSLTFNKPCSREGAAGVAHANIVPCADGVVEGVLYALESHAEIEKMDPYEETPIFYTRELREVETEEGSRLAWVYIGVAPILLSNLKPKSEYLFHILQGREFLSPDYFAQLERVECW